MDFLVFNPAAVTGASLTILCAFCVQGNVINWAVKGPDSLEQPGEPLLNWQKQVYCLMKSGLIQVRLFLNISCRYCINTSQNCYSWRWDIKKHHVLAEFTCFVPLAAGLMHGHNVQLPNTMLQGRYLSNCCLWLHVGFLLHLTFEFNVSEKFWGWTGFGHFSLMPHQARIHSVWQKRQNPKWNAWKFTEHIHATQRMNPLHFKESMSQNVNAVHKISQKGKFQGCLLSVFTLDGRATLSIFIIECLSIWHRPPPQTRPASFCQWDSEFSFICPFALIMLKVVFWLTAQ